MMGETILCSKTMLLRFDSYQDRVARGELKTLIYRTSFRFESLDQLLMIMDDVMDSAGFPKSGEYRHIDSESRAEGNGTEPEEKEDAAAEACAFLKPDPEDRCTADELGSMELLGFHSHLMVLVNKREHCSMQGTVLLSGRVIYFRSGLELLHILHEYLGRRFQKS